MIRQWVAAMLVEAFQKELHAARQEGYETGIEIGYRRGVDESFDSVIASAAYADRAAERGAKDSFARFIGDHEFMK